MAQALQRIDDARQQTEAVAAWFDANIPADRRGDPL